MSTTTIQPRTDTSTRQTQLVTAGASHQRHRRWAAPLTMLGAVLLGVGAPLLRAPTFYYWDDTAGASVGAWRRTAEALLDGRLPLLNLELWRGGNYAAEAAFGLYNPLLLGLYVGTKTIDDLAIAALVIKAFFFLAMALGAYLVCREYGVRPWVAALAGTILPLSGFTLWMDGAAWVTGLTVTALTPWVLWTGKRAMEGRGSLLWAVGAGYLCASAGNPYGMLSAGIVFAALILERLLHHEFRRAATLAVAGAAVALLAVGTYLPFVLTSSVSYRAGSGIYNDEYLSPGWSDLLGLSSPSFQPYVNIFGETTFSFPALYLSWLILPLLPWLRWSVLREHGRGLTAVYALGVVNLLIVTGPSQIGFFRWPVRLLPYLWLGVIVVFAVLLSAGLHRTGVRQRWALTAVAVFAGLWVAFSDVPGQWDRHVFSAAMIAVLLIAVIGTARVSQQAMALVAMAGTLAVLVVQLSWMPVNSNVLDYRFPRSESSMQDRFADYRPGLTVQIADLGRVEGADLSDERVYQDVLFGSMYAVAGVESLTAYSGVGFNALDAEQCVAYQGSTCPEAWDRLWEKPEGADAVLADLLRAQTVVVQRELLDTTNDEPPPGWELRESTPYVDVWERVDRLPWPDGRLSAVSGPITVTSDERTGDVDERVTFRRNGSGSAHLTFARLAWPGYTAEVDGRMVSVEQGPAGLLTVEIPADVDDGTLTLAWSTPGGTTSIAAAGVGGIAAVALGVMEYRRRRATADEDDAAGARPARSATRTGEVRT